MWQRYLQLLAETTTSVQTCVPAYQTTRSLLCRLFDYDQAWNPSPLIDLPWLAPILTGGLALVTLALTLKPSRQHQIGAMLAALAWGVIFAPLGEEYHQTVMLIPLGWLVINWPASDRISHVLLLIAICLYLLPLSFTQSNALSGWQILQAYPRVYAAWLVWSALYFASAAVSPHPAPKAPIPIPAPKIF